MKLPVVNRVPICDALAVALSRTTNQTFLEIHARDKLRRELSLEQYIEDAVAHNLSTQLASGLIFAVEARQLNLHKSGIAHEAARLLVSTLVGDAAATLDAAREQDLSPIEGAATTADNYRKAALDRLLTAVELQQAL